MVSFDPAEFWRERLTATSADLDAVGHRSLGPAYNAFLYRRREEALSDTLLSLGVKPESSCILDVGCGSGYWVDFWYRLGVRRLVGLDLSSAQVERLRERHAGFRFLAGDITTLPSSGLFESHFDLVTLFDVLYHIVDDAKASRALTTISRVMGPRSTLLVFDQIVERDVSLRAHVKFRGRSTFVRLLEQAGLAVTDEIPLFVWLAPPVFGTRGLDLVVQAGYAACGALMRRSRRLGTVVGRSLFRLDRALLRRGIQTPNHRLLVIAKE